MRQPLEDYLHRSFRGTVKAALAGIIFHYLLTGFVSVLSFLLPAPIWLTIEVADCTTCGYQTASAGFPTQQQKRASPMSSAGCLFLSLLLCFSWFWFNWSPLCPGLSRSLPLGKLFFASWLDRIAVRRTREDCPEQHTFLVAAVETGHELSLGMVGFNQTDLSRKTHILSKYFIPLTSGTLHAAECLNSCAGHMSLGFVHGLGSAHQQGELMLTWRKGRVSSSLPDRLHIPFTAWARIETGSSGKYVVTWIMKSSCKSSNALPRFQCAAQLPQQMKQGLLRHHTLSVSTGICPKSRSSLCPEWRRGNSLGLYNYR